MPLNPKTPVRTVAETAGVTQRLADIERRIRALEFSYAGGSSAQIGARIKQGEGTVIFAASRYASVTITHGMEAYPGIWVSVDWGADTFFGIQYTGVAGYPSNMTADLRFETNDATITSGNVHFRWLAVVGSD